MQTSWDKIPFLSYDSVGRPPPKSLNHLSSPLRLSPGRRKQWMRSRWIWRAAQPTTIMNNEHLTTICTILHHNVTRSMLYIWWPPQPTSNHGGSHIELSSVSVLYAQLLHVLCIVSETDHHLKHVVSVLNISTMYIMYMKTATKPSNPAQCIARSVDQRSTAANKPTT